MKGRFHVLRPSLPSGPNRRYVNLELLEGAHVRRRGPTHKYCTSKVPCTVPLVGGPQPLSLPSLENRPRSLQSPEKRVAVRCCPRTRGRGERAGAATWRAPGRRQLRFVSIGRGESPAPAVPKLGKANTRARAPGFLTVETATDRKSLILALPSYSSYSSSSASFSSSSNTATPRPPPPPPASAPCLRPVPSSSTRELSQRFAPRRGDWPAEGAASQWSRSEAASRPALGLPAEPAAAGSRESAGARPPPARLDWRGADTAGTAGARGWSRAGRSERYAPDSRRRTQVVEAEDGVGGRSRWGWPSRCGYLCTLHLRAGPAGRWLGRRGESWLRFSLVPAATRRSPLYPSGLGAAPECESWGGAGTGFWFSSLESRLPR